MIIHYYRGYRVELELPNIMESNTVKVAIYDPEGKYETDYWFSAEYEDPQDWEEEAFESAQRFINRRTRYSR